MEVKISSLSSLVGYREPDSAFIASTISRQPERGKTGTTATRLRQICRDAKRMVLVTTALRLVSFVNRDPR